MTDEPIYLDHNATTAPDGRVIDALRHALAVAWGNPSSVHAPGLAARDVVARARDAVARLVGIDSSEVVFTSGGTEAIALAVWSAWQRRGRGRSRVVVSAVEHPAVLEAARALAPQGADVRTCRVDGRGRIDLDELRALVDGTTAFAAVMYANNEVGTLQPVREAASICAAAGVPLLCDAVQAVGKIPVSMRDVGADYLAVSAHKLYGPKGIGCLCVKHGAACVPIIPGGGQEGGARSGTENVSGIAGFGEACRLACERAGEQARMAALRDDLETRILRATGAAVVGVPGERLPNTIGLLLERVDAQALVIRLSARGVYVSAGSACHTGKSKGSHVLAAMGIGEERGRSFVRVSLGAGTTREEVARAGDIIVAEVERCRSRSGR